jgi:hypothetical protein
MAGSPVLDFELVLKDGVKVSVHYKRRYICGDDHFEFRGDGISSTGYRSHFVREMNIPDGEVIEAALEIAEYLREGRIAEITKENRRRKNKKEAGK